jgi:hypothetical protein
LFSNLKKLSLVLLLGLSAGTAYALPEHFELKKKLVKGQFPEVRDTYKKDKKVVKFLTGKSKKLRIGAEHCILYMTCLVAEGKLDEMSLVAPACYEHDRKDLEIHKFYEDYLLATRNFHPEDNRFDFSQTTKQALKLNYDIEKMLISANETTVSDPDEANLIAESKVTAKQLMEYYPLAKFYLPSRFELLLKIGAEDQAERLAEKIISQQIYRLYPKTPEFYTLSEAYKTMAQIHLNHAKKLHASLFEIQSQGLKLTANDPELVDLKTKFLSLEKKFNEQDKKAKYYLSLAATSADRLKSFWLEEDIHVFHPYMKNTDHSVIIGSVFPQWLETKQLKAKE